jgi:hypothetical protein
LELYGCRLHCALWRGVHPLYTGIYAVRNPVGGDVNPPDDGCR